jgi:hypothetical protein
MPGPYNVNKIMAVDIIKKIKYNNETNSIRSKKYILQLVLKQKGQEIGVVVDLGPLPPQNIFCCCFV